MHKGFAIAALVSWVTSAGLFYLVFVATSGGSGSAHVEVANVGNDDLLPALMVGNVTVVASALMIVGAIFLVASAFVRSRRD